MNDSHEQLSNLSAKQRALLLLRLKKQKGQDAKKEEKAITRQGRDANEFPLSFEQQGIWFLEQFEKESKDYNVATAFALVGQLNVSAFEKAINDLVKRHEILRTTFKLVDGQPTQVISPAHTIPLTRIDLTHLPKDEQTEKVKQLAEEEDNSAFELTRGPLIRVSLLRLENEYHVFFLTIHHIVYDGWSKSIFYNELSELYGANVKGTASKLADLEIQYADFSSWQNQLLESESFARQLDYWKQRLHGAPPEIGLPTDKPRAHPDRLYAKAESFSINPELTTRIRALAGQAGTTTFTVLFSVYALLLSRYCGHQDIIVGVPVANRNRKELERLIGMFVNTVVVRVDLSGNINFLQLLERTKQAVQEGFDNSDIPFQKLVEEIHPQRNTGYMPIFQVTFNLLNAPGNDFALEGLTVNHLELRNVAAGNIYNLAFTMEEDGERINGIPEYNANIFDPATVARMVGNFQTLLEGCLANPELPVETVPILTSSEKNQILVECNDTDAEYDHDLCIHELFEIQAAASPDAVAIDHEGKTLSYQELNERANKLAHYLQARGVGPEVMVGVYMERSLEMVVGLLGILKAGGAYLPLDLDYPQPRIEFMLEDAGVPVLLSLSSLIEQLPEFTGELLCLDSDWAKIENECADNPVPGATADNLAYVIYTSGSTGTPKGVEVRHGGLMNLVSWHTRSYEVGPADRATHLAGLGFDASVWELWPYLASGASLYLVSDERRLAPASLWPWMAAQGITLSFLPTPLAEAALREPIPGDLKLRVLLTGGDRLHGGLVKKPVPFRIVNHYGPTENSVVTTCTEIDVCSPEDPPIGRPIDNVQVYILDKGLQPVPVGVWGELYIGGESLARGYLNQPELTAEKFIPNPFSEEPGARLYRSGDLVRYRKDGQIEFQGRIDHQVKLRGFRIELGEIESVLLSQPVVSDAVVIVHEEEPGDKRLVAYVVADSGDELSESDLRGFVVKSLPNYMVPSAFMVLDKLPLTANGKIDRKALPVPDDVRAGLGVEYTPPSTELEQQLAQIWVEVLKLERVGIHDNFFDLGGHSLMATQVVSRIRGQLNVELPLSEMFGYPTVAELAPVAELLLDESDGDEADVIPVVDRAGDLPLSFAQERLWFLDRLEPGGTAYNVPLALRLMGELNVAALKGSLNAIVDRQEGLRTHFTMHQEKPFQVIDDIRIQLKQDDLSALTEEGREDEVKARVDAEALQPFDLNSGPLLRCRLLRLSDLEHVLLMTMHHVIFDGWSLGVLFRELGVCYSAFSQGKQPALAELPIQYADFAVWQRDWLSGEVLASQMAYWREKLEDLSTLNLPTDRPRPAIQTYNGSIEKMPLEIDLSKRLTALSRQAGVTLFTTMLGGFTVLMQRYSGQEDIVVGTPIANRNRAELEDLIGFFVNSLVMRTDVSGNPGFRELVQRVNRTALDAYEHQDLPFEKLVDEIRPERDLSRNPLFQVMFALQNAPIESLKLRGLTLESVSRELKVSGFDLECYMYERGERLEVVFVYNTDLFDASTIRRMMTHYRRLLEAASASPETPVSQLEILDDEEKQLMLHQWNQTRADYVDNETLHSLFLQQVNRTPQAIAVKFEQHSLSYSELEQKANDIAFLLLAKNVEPGQHVGVYLERSIDLIVAVVGILKAGAVYVPLDPEYPEDRLDYIVSDSDIRVLLSQERFENRLPPEITDVIYLDRDRLYDKVEAQTLPVVTEDALAYIIYTSGSTGKPKGVMVSHAAVVNHAFWTQDLFKLDQTDRILQKSPISFDASVGDIFVPLLNGACIVLAVPAGDKDINYLIEEIQNNKITTLILVPSALRVLLQNITDPAALGTLKRMGCGGEALTRDLKQAYYEKCSAPLYNLYGPTESTIDATSFLCGKDFNRDNIPIGYPISNKQAYILDQKLQPVPIGVHGELHLGGAGLARGYLNQPELTAEKFIADPFSEDPAARLYKTGDLARYRADGSIEYIGRIDQQVKVRGFRIELGEIETVLSQHDSIESCAALIYEDLQGYKNIAAFFVSDSSFSTLSLRNFLRRKLPHFMIPSLFTKLDEIPVTPNGKTDYKTLASYTEGKTVRDGIYLRPETAAEKKIAGIWEALLNVDRVGAGDSFFDIGGHSLLLIQAKSLIEKEVGVSVPMVDFFHQTLGQIANYCEKNQSPEMSTEET